MLGHLVPCGKVTLEWILKTFYAIEDSRVSDHDRVAFHGRCLITTWSVMTLKGKWGVLVKFVVYFMPFRVSVYASTVLRSWTVYLVFTFLYIIRWIYYTVNSPALFFLLLYFNNESFAKVKWFIVSPGSLLFSQPFPESCERVCCVNRDWVLILYKFIHF